ncbi:tol-pal system protein YbgF [Lysobacter solisilvae (ex Woo and Kim 2020)]|uniref:Cell division coordinator CpoB n=1 Tax=Agrilutibacter terrestris TaxID=2865112 RepID=A0A7H0FZ19_9GAMM|nr:tol-pal system protein YbgF [Lysobacter terrestris]QNP41285.1 tol-pal system protein YbgF [Lysobacter terrestris]
MRLRILLPLLLAALASTPAFAQRVSLADRVAALEARANNNQANVDLLNQLTQLRSEVQALRAQVEELQQQNQQLQSTAKAQYLDLDDRLNRLEGAGPVPATPAAATGKPATPTTGKPAAVTATPTVQDHAPTVYGDKGAIAQSAGERAAYDAAFSALKAGQYVQSATLFQDFLQQHPNGSYTPNALYWLGESYYVTQNYALAQEQFQALLDRYPTHDKASGALLKVGLSQYGARQFEAAQRTLAQVTSRYPGTDAARTAADRLNAIQLGQLGNK